MDACQEAVGLKVHPATWSIGLLLAAGLVAGGYYAFQPRTTGHAPDLVVPTLANETFQLSAEQGQRVVVLDFFQIWCEGCKIVEAAIQENLPRWNSSDVRVVSIGVAPANTHDDLSSYAAEHNVTWTVARDTDGAVEKYSIVVLPTVAVVDMDGNVVFHRSGIVQARELNDVVATALAGERAPVQYARLSLWGLAIVAGVASFFSPCAIGLLPAYVGHTVRSPVRGSQRAAVMGLVSAAGVLLVFLAVGALAYAAARFLDSARALDPVVRWLGPFVGAAFILVGLVLLVRPYSTRMQRIFSPLTQLGNHAYEAGSRPGGYFLYGLGYGAGAAGCTAPVLLNLVALAALVDARTGALLVVTYAASAAILMVVLTLVVANGRQAAARWIQAKSHAIEVASALLFIGGGAYLIWFAWRAGSWIL